VPTNGRRRAKKHICLVLKAFFMANIFPPAAERFLSVVFFPPEEIINSEENVIPAKNG
jgi:hypothetical protein